MNTPDRPARERFDELLALKADTGTWVGDLVLDNLPLVLEAAREAGKATRVEAAFRWDKRMGDDAWRLVGLPVQNPGKKT